MKQQLAIVLLLLAGCGGGRVPSGTIECDDSTPCPAGLTCGWDGLCYRDDELTDECAEGATCAEHATCVDEAAGFRCDCDEGWSGDGHTCADEDECERPSPPCDLHADCTNEVGDYSCACQDGWVGDGKTCGDVDECALQLATCDPDASCANTQGDYTCTCDDGFTGDGMTCAPSFVAISTQGRSTCGIRDDGTLWCWGEGADGQLGDGTSTDRRDPAQVGSATDWIAIAAGWEHSCGLRMGGTLWCWGSNEFGQIGDGLVGGAVVPSPTQIGTDKPWRSVVVGASHTCALASLDGSLWCWGLGTSGQLGSGTTSPSTSPARVGSLAWDSLASGMNHTCGLRADAVLCWGANGSGQLGDGSTTQRTSPVPVPGAYRALTAHQRHTCALATDGSATCWGENYYGQVGDGTMGDGTDRLSPTVVTGGHIFTSITTGGAHTCGVRDDGALLCWGAGYNAQLGDGRFEASPAPLELAAGVDWTAVDGASNHTCALHTDGRLACWGINTDAQLGLGTGGDQLFPALSGTGPGWIQLELGQYHACAIHAGDSLWCWGANWLGQVGAGDVAVHDAPTEIAAGTTWRSVSAGWYTTCGLQTDGSLWCWGYNYNGQLGQGTSGADTNSLVPVRVGAETWRAVSVGQFHVCAVRDDGTLHCWGADNAGQLGLPTVATEQTTPQLVDAGTDWLSLSARGNHTCGLRSDGGGGKTLWCWGPSNVGQTGAGVGVATNVPTRVGTAADWTQIATGDQHTCGLRGPTLYCWGYDMYGAVGDGDGTTTKGTPKQIGTARWTAVSSGEEHTCAVRGDATMWCWGANDLGTLGNGETGASGWRDAPAQTGTDNRWASVSAGGPTNSCGLHTDGELWCWGVGWSAMLADGATYAEIPSP
jgi:alpha-tubulin suppressor-like RCC1 family protein